MDIHLNLSGIALGSANPLTTYARFHHKDGIEGSISLTYEPGKALEAQEILSTLQEKSKITVLSYFTQPVVHPLGRSADATYSTEEDK